MIDTDTNYYNTPPAPDVQTLYADAKHQRQQDQEQRREQSNRIRRVEFYPDSYVAEKLKHIPAGDRSRLINAAVKEYLDVNAASMNQLVMVPGSGVFTYDYVEARMDKSIREELDFNNDAITKQNYVDQYCVLHEQLQGFPFIVKPAKPIWMS